MGIIGDNDDVLVARMTDITINGYATGTFT